MKNVSVLNAGVAVAALGMALGATPAFAQEAPASAIAASPEAPSDPIIVTGSRIARPELKASVPIAVVTAQSLENKGQTNLLDALEDLPISGQSLGRTGSNFSNFDNGTATVNLRNLGSSRTLVLINGRRSIGIPGTTAVDLNNIPTDLIKQVEIATGGTSAVYGSDAVAGVVNILLDNHFEGLKLHMQGMTSGVGDAGQQYASLTGGMKFAGGNGHVVANFSYENDEALQATQRGFSANDAPANSSYAAQGLFDTSGNGTFSVADGNTYTFDKNNNVKPYQGAAIDGYRRASQRLLATPVRRYSGTLLADYDFGPAADLYGEFSYTKTKASGHIEALAVDDSGNPGQGVQNLDGSTFLGIPVTNPYVPAQIAAAAAANGAQYIDFRRRSVEIFDRSPVDDRDYFRGVIGLRGSLGSDWKYDASYEHSQVRDLTTSGAILLNNYGAALNATTIGGQIVCADPVARAAGCVPINIFGYNTASPAAIKWLSTYSGVGPTAAGATVGQSVNSSFLRKSHQDVANLTVTGTAFQLPAGPVGIAAGVEYHREQASEIYDPFTVAGISSSQQASNIPSVAYNSKEAYAEISIPVLHNLPFVESFGLEGAARYAKYSTVGSVWTYKYGATWSPFHDLMLRTIYARAVRAPNINELFAQQSLTAISVIDPCDQNAGKGDLAPGAAPAMALPAGCANIAGIAHYLQSHPNFSYSQAQIQSAYGYLGGNPNLQAEATNTFTAGATYQPSFFRGFDVTVDYYDIKVKNAVASVDQQTSVDQCFATGNPQFCNNITRDANGFIKRVDSLSINAASYQVAGIDVQARYALGLHLFNPGERFTAGLYYNHKFKQQQVPYAGSAPVNELGTADQYAGSQLGTGFKNQFTLTTGYSTGPISINYKLRYLGPVTASSGAYYIGAYTYSDIHVAFNVQNKLQFYVGSNNVLNKQPPYIPSGNSQFPGTNTVADTYDVFGRMLYAGVTAKF